MSIAIAQTQTEQASNPSMTAFTIKAACQNRVISDTSVETIGQGFGGSHVRYPLNASVPNPPRGGRLPVPRPRVRHGGKPAREPRDVSHGRPVQSRVMNSPANMSKRGLFARRCVPNQTLIMVNGRLPKGNFGGLKCGGWSGPLTRPGPRRLPEPRLEPVRRQLVRRAGSPTAVQPLGTSQVTTAPAPILAKSPMPTSPRMVAPLLSRTPAPILARDPAFRRVARW